MSYRYLIAWFLYFDILKAHKPRWSYRVNQLTFDSIRLAFITRTLNQWIVLSLTYNLIDFKTTNIANIHCNLHLGFDIACSNNYAFDCDEGANRLSFDLPHFTDLFLGVLVVYYEHLVTSFELFRYLTFAVWVSLCFNISQLDCLLTILLYIETTLVHYDVEGGLVLFSEINRWFGHVLIDDWCE